MSCIDWMKVPWGVPSATRLKKVLEDVGLDGLKKDLPQGAVEGLYDGKGGDSRSGLLAAQFHKQASSSSKHYQSLLLLVRHQHRCHLRLDNNLHQLEGTILRVSIRVAVVVNSHPPLPSVRHQPHR